MNCVFVAVFVGRIRSAEVVCILFRVLRTLRLQTVSSSHRCASALYVDSLRVESSDLASIFWQSECQEQLAPNRLFETDAQMTLSCCIAARALRDKFWSLMGSRFRDTAAAATILRFLPTSLGVCSME